MEKGMGVGGCAGFMKIFKHKLCDFVYSFARIKVQCTPKYVAEKGTPETMQ